MIITFICLFYTHIFKNGITNSERNILSSFEQSPFSQVVIKGGFNSTYPTLTNFAFFCKLSELANGRSNLIYDAFCLSDTVIFAKSQSLPCNLHKRVYLKTSLLVTLRSQSWLKLKCSHTPAAQIAEGFHWIAGLSPSHTQPLVK